MRLRLETDFSLFLRGDDPSSDRLQNAFAALQVPLVVGEGNSHWFPFPHAIPWTRIVAVIDQAAFNRNPTGAIMKTISMFNRSSLLERRRLMLHHIPDLLFSVNNSRVGINFVREVALRSCVPQQRNQSRVGMPM